MVVTPASFVNRMLKSVSVSVLSAGNKGLRRALRKLLHTQACLIKARVLLCTGWENASSGDSHAVTQV